MNNDAVLELRGVSKTYGQRTALDAIDLAIAPAQFVALLGQNGAGKTTLFQLLTGLFNADAGEIRVCGLNMQKQPVQALSGLGVVFQQPTLDLDLSVQGNLKLHCLLHGMSRREADCRIDFELERFGLQSYRQVEARALSGGNRRKVELVRALLHRPRLLLMDEASVGLDPQSRQALLSHVRALCSDRQVSVLWSTHIVEEAESADRVIVLHKGQLLARSTPARLVRGSEPPCHSMAEAFLQLVSARRRLECVDE